ncbi:NACHT domain-containing protein [Amycolatopsis japonica]
MRTLWVVFGAGALLMLGGAVAMLVRLGGRGDELSSVLGFPLVIVGFVIALKSYVLQRRQRPDEVVDQLVRGLRGRAGAALALRLGEDGDARPADVRFRLRDGLTRRSDGGAPGGSTARSGDYFLSLDRRRMVVLGGAGAGKSVLVLQLAVDLLDRGLDDRTGEPYVPVRMDLASFDPFVNGRTLEGQGDLALSDSFDGWLADQLMRQGVSQRQAAERLVAEHRVLPLLDGLDEMGDPARSVAVLRALNIGARTRPFVLTCRPEWFAEVSERVRLCDTSVVELQPLSPAAVRGYLIGRLDWRADEPRWRKALKAIEVADGGAFKWPNPFADALRSPWRLYLCVTAFAERGDPYDELAGMAPDEVTDHLLRRLIPELTARHASTHGSHWRPEDVTHWLRIMARSSEPLRHQSAEISIPALWPAAGRVLPRFVGALCQASIGWMMGLAILLADSPPLFTVDDPVWTRWIFALCLMLMVCGTAFINTGMPVMVSELSLHLWRSAKGWRTIATSILPFSILGGAVMAGVFSIVLSVRFALVSGLAVFVLLFCQLALARRPTVSSRPSQVVRRSVVFDVTMALSVGAAFATMASIADQPVLASGVIGAFLLARPTWFRYGAAIVLGRRGNRLPWRPARFLDWAHEVGLVRLSGGGVEFRHPELRAWLLEHEPEQRPGEAKTLVRR